MKLKATLFAIALLGLSAAGHAAPSLQTCSPMEVVHDGVNGLSYTLACKAGGWSVTYRGSIPSGSDEVVAKYRLTVNGDRGESFTQGRQVRLPEPALLGQVLLREAVLLDSGDLALRACDPVGCTQYRPLGSTKVGLTEATITGSQEIIRLKSEVLRLDELATSRADELTKAKAELEARQAAVAQLQGELGRVSGELTLLKQQAVEDRQALEAKVLEAEAKREQAEKAVIAAVAGANTAPPAVETTAEATSISKDRQLAAILGLDDELAGKYERLKLVHEETLQKLERAQNQSAMASARLETLTLTQSLTAQTLALAHADLDAARHELTQLKRDRAQASASTAPASAGAVEAGGTLSRVAAALVSSNTQVGELKAELERLKALAGKPRK